MKKIKQFSTIMLYGFLISIILSYALNYSIGIKNYFGFMVPSEISFSDFFSTYESSLKFLKGIQVYGLNQTNYLPMVNILFVPFTFFYYKISLIIYSVIVFCFFVFYIKRNIEEQNILNEGKIEVKKELMAMILTAYPLLFLIDRGNVEGIIFIGIVLFFYFEQKNKDLVAILILVVLINIKIYPIVLATVFLWKKKIKELLLIGVLSILVLIYGLMIMPGGFEKNLVGLVLDLRGFDKKYAYYFWGNSFEHTFYMLFKMTNDIIHYIEPLFLKKIYFRIAILIFLFSAYYTTFIEKILWKRVMIVIICMTTLPFVSFDYTLIHFYIPLMLFFKNSSDEKRNNLYVILFSLILLPKNIIYNISCFINPIIIGVFYILIVYDGFKSRQMERE